MDAAPMLSQRRERGIHAIRTDPGHIPPVTAVCQERKNTRGNAGLA
jgi:hypothetical protein